MRVSSRPAGRRASGPWSPTAGVALVGQSVIDRVTLPGQPQVERLGGAPIFAGQAVRAASAEAVILTRGGSPALRRPLHQLGLSVVEGPPAPSCISEMVLHPDGSCWDSFVAFGTPFTPADVHGWMAPGLEGVRAVVCGAQWRDDFPPDTIAALAAGGRKVYLDGQGPLRPRRLGPIRLDATSLAVLAAGVAVLKLAEEEAAVALGGPDPGAARALGVPVVLVTRGHRGAIVLAGGRAVEVGVDPVLGLADTVGAGDAFLALVAVAEMRGATLVEATARACAGVAAMLRARLAPAACSDGEAGRLTAFGGTPQPGRATRKP